MFALRHYWADDGGSPDPSVSVAAQMWGNTWGQWPWDDEGATEIEDPIDRRDLQRDRAEESRDRQRSTLT